MDAGLVGILLPWRLLIFLALLSPGPDFVIVVKSAVRNKGKKSVGCCIWYCQCECGLYWFVSYWGRFYSGCFGFSDDRFKIIGGLFLVYLAVQAIRAKKCNYSNIDVVEEGVSIQTTFLKEFVTGFLSGILNPKTCCSI